MKSILILTSLLHLSLQATLDLDNNVIPAVLKGFPVRTSTNLPGYNGKPACIADKARLKYFKYPDGRYITHCDCWTPNLQPSRGISVREDWIEVNLWEPKLVREVVVQGCTDYERQWVSAFKVQYTYDGLKWQRARQRNKGRHGRK